MGTFHFALPSGDDGLGIVHHRGVVSHWEKYQMGDCADGISGRVDVSLSPCCVIAMAEVRAPARLAVSGRCLRTRDVAAHADVETLLQVCSLSVETN
jgi:hypothetical protein